MEKDTRDIIKAIDELSEQYRQKQKEMIRTKKQLQEVTDRLEEKDGISVYDLTLFEYASLQMQQKNLKKQHAIEHAYIDGLYYARELMLHIAYPDSDRDVI